MVFASDATMFLERCRCSFWVVSRTASMDWNSRHAQEKARVAIFSRRQEFVELKGHESFLDTCRWCQLLKHQADWKAIRIQSSFACRESDPSWIRILSRRADSATSKVPIASCVRESSCVRVQRFVRSNLQLDDPLPGGSSSHLPGLQTPDKTGST